MGHMFRGVLVLFCFMYHMLRAITGEIFSAEPSAHGSPKAFAFLLPLAPSCFWGERSGMTASCLMRIDAPITSIPQSI